ncbi:unnamed protein product [Moneuplotes crassus]|uniref:C2H2-type domain-containing protein n=1 Tax=Euplotes crassus TaxID=5936 RepID=A0AAD1Y7J5_EUPCR|nr:unnamed protein product [Moneuplotes crassus]
MQNILTYPPQLQGAAPYVLISPVIGAGSEPMLMPAYPAGGVGPVAFLTNPFVAWTDGEQQQQPSQCQEGDKVKTSRTYPYVQEIHEGAGLYPGYYKEYETSQQDCRKCYKELPTLNQVSEELVNLYGHQSSPILSKNLYPEQNFNSELVCRSSEKSDLNQSTTSMDSPKPRLCSKSLMERGNKPIRPLDSYCFCYNFSKKLHIPNQNSDQKAILVERKEPSSDSVRHRRRAETNFLEELEQYQGSFLRLTSSIQDGMNSPAFRCNINGCNKGFHRAQNIVMHLRVHFGIKNFSCDFCAKKFIQKGNRDKHMKLHLTPNIEERRVIKCQWCDVMFTEKHNLQMHLKQVHNCDKA